MRKKGSGTSEQTEALQSVRDISERTSGEASVPDILRDSTERNQAALPDIGKRTKTEEQLQKLSLAVEQSPASIVITDTNGTIEYVNPKFTQITGYSAEEALGKNPRILKSGETAPEEYENLWAAITAGREWRGEFKNRKRNGEHFWEMASISPVKNLNGVISHFVAVKEDITTRKQTEEALRVSEEHFREMFVTARRQAKELELLSRVRTAITGELELPEVIRTVVEGIAATFGYTQVSVYLLRGEVLELQHHVGYQLTVQTIPISRGVSGRVARTGLPVLLEDARTDPEFIETTKGVRSELCIPLFDQRRVVGILNVESKDDLKLDEADLRLMTVLGEHVSIAIVRARLYADVRRSEERYRSLVENLGEGIATVDPAENFLFANPAAEKVFGVAGGSLAGQNLRQFLSEEEYQLVRAETGRRRLGETSTFEQVINRPDGTARRIELTATPQYDHAGAFSHTLGIFRDVTDERRIQEALRKSEERLAQVQKLDAVGRLAGGVAHDFNNLLTVIHGYADLLNEQLQENDPMKANAQEITRAADRAADLTAQLLAFSRGQMLQPRILDLNNVVRRMQNMMGRLVGEDIELRTHIAPTPATVKADQGQIEQVLMNLAANARDAMPRGGVLDIRTARCTLGAQGTPENSEIPPGEYVTLEVSDTGIGMDKETLKRIFEPFFTTKDVGKGTGLGLATVYGIVTQSGGHISCASQPGAGTTFTVYLVSAREAVQGKSTSLEPRSRQGSESVLVVEDEDAIRKLILSVLRTNGYAASEARNGAEAMAIFSSRTTPFQLLLTDVVMPRMSGIELGRRIEEVDHAIKVLYMTGYSKHPLVQVETTEVVVDMLRKPFTAKQLLKKIREVLDEG